MKRYIKATKSSINFEITIDVLYHIAESSVAASKELDSMDLSDLDTQIVNFPDSKEIDTNSDAYKKFINFVNRVDELLELRGFDFLGESEFTETDSESKYRGILFNISKNLEDAHIFGKVMHTLRLSGHKETSGSRRTRQTKLEDGANSGQIKSMNNGKVAKVGEFESIRIKCTVDGQEDANISNKEFYSYLDAIKCIDLILDRWESQS